MAILSNESMLAGISGKVGNVVFKKYGDKIVVSAKPDMSKVKPTKLQKNRRKKFADAVQYAKAILANPNKKAAYEKKVKEGEKVFHFAIREFMARDE